MTSPLTPIYQKPEDMATPSSKPSPLASVILPAYNAENTISETIESVLNQTFGNFEFIIIDDGSNDRTKQIIESYKDDRIAFNHRANKGLVKTLNEALSVSKGQFILRIDADDIAHKERFEKQLSFMSQHPETGILGCQATIIDDYGQRIGLLQSPLTPTATLAFSQHACPILHPTYCVRKEVYADLGGYRQLPCEDYDFILRAIETDIQIQNLPDVLVDYRVSQKGITRSNPRKIVDATHIHQKLHAVRTLGGDESALLRRLKNSGTGSVRYFRWLHAARARYIQKRSSSTGLQRFLAIAALAFFSLGHHALLRDSIKKYRAGRVMKNLGQNFQLNA